MSYLDSGFNENLIRRGYAGAESNDAEESLLLEEIAATGVLPISEVLNSLKSGDFINQSNQVITDIINARLDTASKEILGSFTFGASGAIAINTDANNGMWLSPTGILAKKAGVTTFAIDASGNITITGGLTAATGTLGALTMATGGNIKMGKTAYTDDTNAGFWLGDVSGTAKLNIGASSSKFLHYDGTDFELRGGTIKADHIYASSVTNNSNVHLYNTAGAGQCDVEYNNVQIGFFAANSTTTILGSNYSLYLEADDNMLIKANGWLQMVYNYNGGTDVFQVSNEATVVFQMDDSNDAWFADALYAVGNISNGGNIQCGGTFKSSDGTSGGNYSGYGFVTAVESSRAKFREFTIKDGLVTNISSETGWV